MRFVSIIMVMFFSFSSVASTNVSAGDTVSEDGVFLTLEEAAKIVAEKRGAVEQCHEFHRHESEIYDVERRAAFKNLEIRLESQKEKNSFIVSHKDEEIDRLYEQIQSEGGEYDEYIFIGGILAGVITTAIISTALFFAAVQTAKTDSVIK